MNDNIVEYEPKKSGPGAAGYTVLALFIGLAVAFGYAGGMVGMTSASEPDAPSPEEIMEQKIHELAGNAEVIETQARTTLIEAFEYRLAARCARHHLERVASGEDDGVATCDPAEFTVEAAEKAQSVDFTVDQWSPQM